MTDDEIMALWGRCQDEADERYTREEPLGRLIDVGIKEMEGWIEREAVKEFAKRVREN